MTLADWAAIWRGAAVTIDPSAKPDVDAAAQTVDDLIASGRAVYGLNTGFGKLAQTRIADDELATLYFSNSHNRWILEAPGVTFEMTDAVEARIPFQIRFSESDILEISKNRKNMFSNSQEICFHA